VWLVGVGQPARWMEGEMGYYIRIYDRNENQLDIEPPEEIAPRCGEDFCEVCGDCLDCYGGDDCSQSESGAHLWMVYEDEIPALRHCP
jgi:hypothetical protein